MPFPLEGFNAIAQKHISRGIGTAFYAKSPLLYLLAGKTAATTNEPLKIGRAGSGEILAGVPISQAQRMALRGVNSYNPRIQAFKTNNTKVMAARDTMPGLGAANNTTSTTLSHGQAVQAAAEFRWAKISTPIQIWNTDVDRAIDGNEGRGREGQGVAVGQLIEEATQVAMEEHYDQLASRFLYGSPSNQDADPWDDLPGIFTAVSATNTYGRVDRTTLSTGSAWLGNLVSTAQSADIVDIINKANITYKANVVGSGIDLVLCGGANYIKFKNTILNRGGVIVQNGAGLPEMAKMGVKREVLQMDNTYVMYDPGFDTCYAANSAGTALYTAQPNYVACLNLSVWKLMFHPKYNCTVTPFQNLKNTGVANPDLSQAFIESQVILSCDKPAVQVLFTNVS